MIKERLLALPDEIKEVKELLLSLQEDLEEIQFQMNKWELEQIEDIANAVDEKGKPIYSNDAKRRAELEKRKETNKQYNEWLEASKKLKHSIAIQNIILDWLYNQQGNLRAICRLEGASND